MILITNNALWLNLTLLKHDFVLFLTAFHYPELNTSQLLRFSWVRTGIVVSVLGMMESCYSYLNLRPFELKFSVVCVHSAPGCAGPESE